MTQQFTNNGTGTLASGITNVATTANLNGGDGANFPALTGSDFFYATLYQVIAGLESNWEIIKVTARATDTLTIVRGQQGTTARAFSTGDPIQLRWTKSDADIAVSARPSVPVRQTVLSGALSAGAANLLAAGSGLALNLSATAVAVQLAFAAGFSAGAVDFVSQLTADVTGVVASLPANNTSFISATYVDAATVTWNKTLAPPQYGYTYDRARQSVLQFGGSAGATTFLDDYGNTWAAQGGAKVQTNQFKYGTGGLGGGGAANVLNGTTDYVKNAGFTSFGVGGWALRAWAYPTTLPGSNLQAQLMTTSGATVGVTSAMVGVVNNAGTIRFGYSLSSAGAGYDIVGNAQGTTLPVVNNWYFIELTYDALAGVYRLYVNGVQEQSTTSALRTAGGTTMFVGGRVDNTSGFQGYIDKPEFLPYCQHPGGTTYTSPAATPDITAAGYSSDYFSIPQMKMFSITSVSGSAGADPGMTALNEVFVGECDTGASTVTAVRNYAYQGKYQSADVAHPGISSKTVFAANIGVQGSIANAYIRNVSQDNGLFPGDIVAVMTQTSASFTYIPQSYEGRNTVNVSTGNSSGTAFAQMGKTGGIAFSPTVASWRLFVTAQRSF